MDIGLLVALNYLLDLLFLQHKTARLSADGFIIFTSRTTY